MRREYDKHIHNVRISHPVLFLFRRVFIRKELSTRDVLGLRRFIDNFRSLGDEMNSVMEYRFFVDGLPIAKGRPRFARCGSFTRTYTPKKTEVWEKVISWKAKEHSPVIMPTGAMAMDLKFHFKKPKSASKRINHVVRPDVDNLAKCVLDALNERFYKDDSQIVNLNVSKQYSEIEGVEIKICLLESQVH